jgi:putative transposase
MPRANRISCPGYVWHITHRCHKKSFLLKFAIDRKRWRHWLFEAKRRYGLCVLNYIATSNHVHLLVADQGNREIQAAMRLVAGRTAQEFNKRKNRQGAFWEDRYHATAVQTNQHLEQCMTYIDLNMVRAGAVTTPDIWDVSGYSEIQAPWKRKGVIDFPALCQLFGASSIECLANSRNESVYSALPDSEKQPAWTNAVGVGDEIFLDGLRHALGAKGRHRHTSVSGEFNVLKEARESYFKKIAAKSTD